ncbi:MAG: M20/M25/M40 family metallo-hydrolase [Alicyclobacillus sp.]|nr:M20/M25/M40 family metallo-hydrolase [Alicyclobacillus sp.]
MRHRSTFMELLALPGGPGFEEAVAERIHRAFLAYTHQVETDHMGNVLAYVPGSATPVPTDLGEHLAPTVRPRVLLAAHMDEIALMVTRIESGGFLRLAQTGGFDARTLLSQEVWVHGRQTLLGVIGAQPPHLSTSEERQQTPSLDDLYVDLALPEARVRELVRPGDRVTLARTPYELLNGRISGKALDNRASVAILLECLEHLRSLRHTADVWAVATVQEEVGMRGASVVGYRLQPHIALAVDVTFAEFPGQAPDESFPLGSGPAIAFGPNVHPKVFAGLRAAATRHRVPFHIEFTQGPTGTDARVLQLTASGLATGLVGIPIRYMHCSVETAVYDDIVECGRLLAHYLADLTMADVEGLTCY